MSENKKVSRLEMQQALVADIEAAIAKAFKGFGLDSKNPDANRRVFRALVTIGASRLLDLGAPSQVIAQQAFEAITSEIKHRQGSSTQQLFGAGGPPASA